MSDTVTEITAAEAARILDCSPSTVSRLATSGRLVPVRKMRGLRGPYLFDLAAVQRLRAERRERRAS